MIGHKDELRLGGRPLATTITRREGELIELVLAHLVSELDVYEALPAEALRGDITQAIERGIRLFLATMATGAMPGEDDLVELSESAARRAEERIPLDAVLSACQIAVRVVIEAVAAEVRPDETADFLQAVLLALAFLRSTSTVVVERYVEERQMISDARTDAERARLDALLTGSPLGAEVAGELASSYVVVRVLIGAHADELDRGVGASVAAHRKLRRLRSALASSGGGGVLSSLSASGGVVLVPSSGVGPLDDTERAHLAALVAALQAAAGADLHAVAVDAATVEGVPAQSKLADEVLDLVVALGRPPGLYRLDDVVLEHQLTRPGPARRLLADQVAPLVAHADLLLTLRTFLATGQNRRQAAIDLHVHPNTVDYRIRKVAGLTGLEPTDHHHAARLAAALVAFDAEAEPALVSTHLGSATASGVDPGPVP